MVQAPQLSLDQVLPPCHSVLINVVTGLYVRVERPRSSTQRLRMLKDRAERVSWHLRWGLIDYVRIKRWGMRIIHCIMRTDQRASLIKLLDDGF
ncbi:unnamed protein product [Fusarium fujikuroi]|nr:unnamed protein product [Fusarium fujikuroi]